MRCYRRCFERARAALRMRSRVCAMCYAMRRLQVSASTAALRQAPRSLKSSERRGVTPRMGRENRQAKPGASATQRHSALRAIVAAPSPYSAPTPVWAA